MVDLAFWGREIDHNDTRRFRDTNGNMVTRAGRDPESYRPSGALMTETAAPAYALTLKPLRRVASSMAVY